MKKIILGATGSILFGKKVVADGGQVHLVGRDEPSFQNSLLNSTFTTCDK